MDISKTLPGSIPGLVRRGSPVWVRAHAPKGVRDAQEPYWAKNCVYDVNEAGVPKHMADRLWADMRLDLEDPTGLVHVHWWLTKHMPKLKVRKDNVVVVPKVFADEQDNRELVMARNRVSNGAPREGDLEVLRRAVLIIWRATPVQAQGSQQ